MAAASKAVGVLVATPPVTRTRPAILLLVLKVVLAETLGSAMAEKVDTAVLTAGLLAKAALAAAADGTVAVLSRATCTVASLTTIVTTLPVAAVPDT